MTGAWLSANPEVMWLHATFFLQTTTLFVSTKSWLFLSSLSIMRTIWIKTWSAVKKHGKLVRLWCQSSTLFQQCFSTNQFSIVQQTIFPLFNMHLRRLSNNLKNPPPWSWMTPEPSHKEKPTQICTSQNNLHFHLNPSEVLHLFY